MACIGATLGLAIALANKFFAIEVDARIEEVEEMLPSANCGGCGYAGCAAFAKAVVEEQVEPAKCPVCSSEEAEAIASFMGMTVELDEPYVALVKCCGDNVHSPERALYNGVTDCNAAVLVAGATKSCQHGCLGMASCARVCPFNAIEIDEELMIAKVHPELCVGCGKCVDTCPRNLIEMVPKASPVQILCNSPEKAPVQRKSCAKGCIGCRKCAKVDPESIKMNGFLATMDYKNYSTEMSIIDVCPVNCIHPTLGTTYTPEPKPAAAEGGEVKAPKKLHCHKTLEIEPTATEAEVKKAFAQKMANLTAGKIAALPEGEQAAAQEEVEKIKKAYKPAMALAKKLHGDSAVAKENA
jgi:electron transport complex protein RnfB